MRRYRNFNISVQYSNFLCRFSVPAKFEYSACKSVILFDNFHVQPNLTFGIYMRRGKRARPGLGPWRLDYVILIAVLKYAFHEHCGCYDTNNMFYNYCETISDFKGCDVGMFPLSQIRWLHIYIYYNKLFLFAPL